MNKKIKLRNKFIALKKEIILNKLNSALFRLKKSKKTLIFTKILSPKNKLLLMIKIKILDLVTKIYLLFLIKLKEEIKQSTLEIFKKVKKILLTETIQIAILIKF